MNDYEKPFIFKYLDYKKYVLKTIDSLAAKGVRNVKSKLAEFIPCAPSMISKVLKGELNFSLEQSYRVAEYFQLNDREVSYLLMLVEYERAGSANLKNHLKNQLKEISAEELQDYQKSLELEGCFGDSEKEIFYSSWHYLAVVFCCGLDHIKSATDISQHLGLSLPCVQKTLSFLTSLGVIENKNGSYSSVMGSIQQPPSISNSRNNINWRNKAIDKIQLGQGKSDKDLCLSAIMSLSQDDFLKLKVLIYDFIKDAHDEVQVSKKKEVAACLNIDLFDISTNGF